MADTLSRADIDALLDTFAQRKVAERSTTDRREEVETETYDFSHPDLLSRDQVRSIRTLHEGFAQALAKRLSTELLTNVSASVVSVDHLTYGEFLMLLPTPTVLAVVEIPDLEGNIAIEINPDVSFTIIDRLLGGFGDPIGKVRSLTAIEQGLMERILQKCCQELDMIWAPILHLRFTTQSIEGNPELARVVGPDEMVVLVSLEVRVNDVSGMMNLCLPYVVMEPALQRLGQGTTYRRTSDRSSDATKGALEASLRRCPVVVDVDLGTSYLSLQDLLDLEVGDVLRFTPLSPEGAVGSIEGVPRVEGRPGRSRGRLAFRASSLHPRPSDEGGEGEGENRG